MKELIKYAIEMAYHYPHKMNEINASLDLCQAEITHEIELCAEYIKQICKDDE
jgi:hypothetical protein